ncbi:MAG: MMPL family transporter [Bacteroidales bacterium]|nr:MMPL family transporter [Bacteroidales bacterium]
MTQFCITIYRYFRNHRAVYWFSMVFLLLFFGYFASKIHLEEDLGKMLPSSKNEDGTTKLAFQDLKLKDKSFVMFEAKEGATCEDLIARCDSFINVLNEWNLTLDPEDQVIDDVFDVLPMSQLFSDGYDFLYDQLATYVDTSVYASIDTMLTLEHITRQLKKNEEDATALSNSSLSIILQAHPEIFWMDPIGMRDAIIAPFKSMLGGGMGGNYTFIDNHFFTNDSSVCIVFLTPTFTSFNTGKGAKLFAKMNEEIKKMEDEGCNVKAMYHGSPASGAYNSWQTKADLKNTISGSLIVVLIIIFFCFRNYNTIPLLLLPVGFGTVFGLAMMYFIKGQFSLLALGIGAIVLGVALSYVLHVLTHYKYVSDPEQVLRDQVKPVFLGCLTTIGSFMGLIFINTELLQDFGLFATFAIVGTTAFSLLYLPQFFNPNKNKINRHAFAIIDRINAYPFDNNKPLVFTIMAIVAICLGFYFVGGTNFDADMRNLGYLADNVVYSETLYKSKTYNGYKQQYFASSGDTMEEALNNFSVLAEKLDSLKAEGLVQSYTPTSSIFVPEKVQVERINAWKNYWTDDKVALVDNLITQACPNKELRDCYIQYFNEIAQYDYEPSHLYEQEVLPKGFVSTMMEENVGGCLVFTSIQCEDDVVRSDSTDYHRICDAIAKHPNLLVLDTYYYTQDTLKQLNEDFNILQWVSMAFVFMVLLFSFKFNIKYTLLGFMPIVLSWLIVLGAMVIFDVRFNLINIIISTFIFGIGVDYSIFVMSGLIDGQDDKKRTNTLLQYHKTAILLSAMVLIVTVASMCFALHPAIQSVGFATVVGMASAVIISYVVQPFLFRMMHKKKQS